MKKLFLLGCKNKKMNMTFQLYFKQLTVRTWNYRKSSTKILFQNMRKFISSALLDQTFLTIINNTFLFIPINALSSNSSFFSILQAHIHVTKTDKKKKRFLIRQHHMLDVHDHVDCFQFDKQSSRLFFSQCFKKLIPNKASFQINQQKVGSSWQVVEARQK